MFPDIASTFLAATGGRGHRPLILGHRGSSAIHLENTVAAFSQAMRDGADGVELDVQRCLTGEIFVFHDDDLVRLAGRPGCIARLSAEEIRRIRLPNGHSIPTLAEAFEACGPHAIVNIELKIPGSLFGASSALVDAVAMEVERARAGDRVVVSSFNLRAVREWARRFPNAGFLFEQIGKGTFPWPMQPRWFSPWLQPFSVHPEASLCSPRRVSDWQRRGWRVLAWTVDDPQELRRLHELKVDGLITNDPASARRALSLTP